jgi:hypothetical protein
MLTFFLPVLIAREPIIRRMSFDVIEIITIIIIPKPQHLSRASNSVRDLSSCNLRAETTSFFSLRHLTLPNF